MQDLNRRDFIKGAGVATLGLAAISGIAGTLLACSKTKEPATQKSAVYAAQDPLVLPWPYIKLDAAACAERAYTAYYNGGCMYGAFEGLIGELVEKVGEPYNTFPSTMMKYGGAGVQGWGTLCGCLNGIAAALPLVTDAKVSGPMTTEVFGWYTATELPDYQPAAPKFTNIAKSISDSPLCHISVTKWCNVAGYKALSPERAERCAWVTASTVYYTVGLLNKAYDNAFTATYAVPASVTGCLSCHGKGGAFENVHTSKAPDCEECHTDLATEHPTIFK
jgi:hypothetical protein